MPTPLPITGRPVRVAVVGLGTVSELVLPPYMGRDDVQVVGLCDPDPARRERWGAVWPDAGQFATFAEMHPIDADVVDVLVPTPLHADVVCEVLDAGYHVQVQKPLARTLADADRMLDRVAATGAVLRVLEDYLFFPPIAALKDVLESGDIGEPAGLHMKIVATGRGGWDVPMSSFQWIFEQAQRDGMGLLVFDHGWHQLAVAMWLLGDVRRVYVWLGETEIVPGVAMDAPATVVWEHTNGVRGVLEITFAPDTYFRSEYYTGDERVELTGTKGFVRCNRISAFGIQEPSVEIYREGEIRALHALDDTLPAGFQRSAQHAIDNFTGKTDELLLDGKDARRVLAAVLAIYRSAKLGQAVDVRYDAS